MIVIGVRREHKVVTHRHVDGSNMEEMTSWRTRYGRMRLGNSLWVNLRDSYAAAG
ncbi:hypothetical protein KCP69_25545 [Salmonella enterica subsp. enterica]|nr:hypothetical protein KCP69_25545 [Salmonella enterica subsp. enterica]